MLSERGLEPALRALADRAPLPVELDVAAGERLPGPVEAAAYYVVAEALTNVAKYASATLVRVRRRARETAARRSRWPTTASAARTPPAAPACAASATASRRSVAGSRSTAPGAGTTLRAEIPLSA